MIIKRVLSRDRLRTPPASGLSWIDRRFFRDGFATTLSSAEILLYFFLCTAGDRYGLSYYSERSIAALLKLPPQAIEAARRTLERCDLILFREPLYQVLALPASPLPAFDSSKRDNGPQSIADILRGSP